MKNIKDALEQAVSFARQVACIEGVRRNPELKAIAEKYQAVFDQALSQLTASPDREKVAACARKCADDLVQIIETATKVAARTGNTFVIDRRKVATMIAGHLAPDEAAIRAGSTANLISIIADIREKTGVGGKPMLNDLADAIAAEMDRRVADEREQCAKVAIARSDAVMVEAEAAHDDEDYDLYERLEYQAGDYADLAAAIRSQEAGR